MATDINFETNKCVGETWTHETNSEEMLNLKLSNSFDFVENDDY